MEYTEWRYWAHITFIATFVLLILQLSLGDNMLTVTNVLMSTPLIGTGDIVADVIFRQHA